MLEGCIPVYDADTGRDKESKPIGHVAQRFTMSFTRSASAAAMVPPPGAILFIT
jgi:hypothetical protein